MTPDRMRALASTYRDALLENVLPFWLSHAVDREHGGFITALDRNGRILDTDKGMWPLWEEDLIPVMGATTLSNPRFWASRSFSATTWVTSKKRPGY